mmetsp:Transcript_318/g.914  ORF Transcript_318/g.914 Transcript_318/m.914 type:complete len:90 (-) Transcript_318:261-530(-)
MLFVDLPTSCARFALPGLQGIDMDDLSNPWKAATSSAIAFVVGAGVFLPAPPPHNFIPKIDLRFRESLRQHQQQLRRPLCRDAAKLAPW